MDTLRDVLAAAQARGSAVAHFNVSDFILIKAIVEAAQEAHQPVVIGLSEGERQFFGVRQVVALIRAYRETSAVPIFLNADHTHSLESAVEAARAGFDSVVFDMSSHTFEDNIRVTREAVATLRAINPNFIVEGEIGDIGSGSQIHDIASTSTNALTTPDEAQRFVKETGVDVLAPAVGNLHGMSQSMARGETRKHVNVQRIAQIKEATGGTFLTLHGASGTADEDLVSAVRAGINQIHINTELRVAWRNALVKSLQDEPDEVVPYKVLPPVVEAVKQVALARLALYSR